MEGALSFALPLNVGQTLNVTKTNNDFLFWNANTLVGTWFTAKYNIKSFDIIDCDNALLAKKLQNILLAVKGLSPDFMADGIGVDVNTFLDFNPEFGFGTSSTLISNIAYWADVDPYKLLDKTFGGSGYDIACARVNTPILYRKSEDVVHVESIDFNPIFKDKLFFVYLGKKQNSADGISAFKKLGKYDSGNISRISDITKQLITTNDFDLFKELITEHEVIMSRILGMPTVVSLYFNDFDGAVKSLGAWGGDFVMMASDLPENEIKSYLFKKGFNTVFRFDELVL